MRTHNICCFFLWRNKKIYQYIMLKIFYLGLEVYISHRCVSLLFVRFCCAFYSKCNILFVIGSIISGIIFCILLPPQTMFVCMEVWGGGKWREECSILLACCPSITFRFLSRSI